MAEKRLQARKIEGYVLEPLFDAIGTRWQSHHVTNPAAFRPSFDRRVYLGYRAGGDRDHYCIGDIDVWSSSLGLAILDEKGESIQYRFPFPIMKISRAHSLPQSPEEYAVYEKKHGDEIVVLHDFRLYEYEGYLYVVYHDGTIHKAYDCVKRMPVDTFRKKVDESVALMQRPPREIIAEWHEIWWGEAVWENAGIEGTRLIYPADTHKNDIIFFCLGNLALQMCHRPLPDMAVLDTEGALHGKHTFDGYTEMGTLETCVRPGYFDNSHVGANGMPTRARIGDVDVYIDVCHGVHNKTLAQEGEFNWAMIYLPYFRVKEYETGELLYYSEEPIVEMDGIWKEYTENGRWIKLISHLHILFAGGQVEVHQGRNNLDDEFTFYAGAGDTAIARAVFTIRDLLPDVVISDIMARKSHRACSVHIPESPYCLDEKVSGWKWCIHNNEAKRALAVIRTLEKNGIVETAERVFNTAPGYFDADLMLFDGKSVRYEAEIGWYVLYKGIRWTEEYGRKQTTIGFGVLILDKDNLEKLLYRLIAPIEDGTFIQEGWTAGEGIDIPEGLLGNVEKHIPQQVLFEIKRANTLIAEGKHWQSHHTLWLRKRAGMEG